MNKKELRALALRLQEAAGEKIMRGCFTDIWLDDKVHAEYACRWSVDVRADELMELCEAVLRDTK